MTSAQIYTAGLCAIIGCVVAYVTAGRAERRLRRTKMLASTGATKLLDGERYPKALDSYEGT